MIALFFPQNIQYPHNITLKKLILSLLFQSQMIFFTKLDQKLLLFRDFLLHKNEYSSLFKQRISSFQKFITISDCSRCKDVSFVSLIVFDPRPQHLSIFYSEFFQHFIHSQGLFPHRIDTQKLDLWTAQSKWYQGKSSPCPHINYEFSRGKQSSF